MDLKVGDLVTIIGKKITKKYEVTRTFDQFRSAGDLGSTGELYFVKSKAQSQGKEFLYKIIGTRARVKPGAISSAFDTYHKIKHLKPEEKRYLMDVIQLEKRNNGVELHMILEKINGKILLKFKHFTEQNLMNVLKQLIEGLRELEKVNIVHNDIKVDNVLLDKNFNLKIIDFDESYLPGQNQNRYSNLNFQGFYDYLKSIFYDIPGYENRKDPLTWNEMVKERNEKLNIPQQGGETNTPKQDTDAPKRAQTSVHKVPKQNTDRIKRTQTSLQKVPKLDTDGLKRTQTSTRASKGSQTNRGEGTHKVSAKKGSQTKRDQGLNRSQSSKRGQQGSKTEKDEGLLKRAQTTKRRGEFGQEGKKKGQQLPKQVTKQGSTRLREKYGKQGKKKGGKLDTQTDGLLFMTTFFKDQEDASFKLILRLLNMVIHNEDFIADDNHYQDVQNAWNKLHDHH